MTTRRGCAIPSATLNAPSALLTACIPHTLTISLEPSPRNPRHRRALMNASRLVSLAAALVITATEAAFFSLPLHAVAAPVASTAADDALPVVVVTAHRHS